VKKQPKPCIAWACVSKKSLAIYGWNVHGTKEEALTRCCSFERVIRVRIVPVAPKKRAKAKRGAK
jgi:hypothetical protein